MGFAVWWQALDTEIRCLRFERPANQHEITTTTATIYKCVFCGQAMPFPNRAISVTVDDESAELKLDSFFRAIYFLFLWMRKPLVIIDRKPTTLSKYLFVALAYMTLG